MTGTAEGLPDLARPSSRRGAWDLIDSIVNGVEVSDDDWALEDLINENAPDDIDRLIRSHGAGMDVPALWQLFHAAEMQLRMRVKAEGRALRAAGVSRLVTAIWWDRVQIGICDSLDEFAAESAGYTTDQLNRALRWFQRCPPEKRLTPIHTHVHRLVGRDGWWCAYCGTELACACDVALGLPQAVSDHVIPRSRGGSDDDTNRVLTCIPCNSSKRDMTPDEWGRPLWGWCPS